MLFDIRPSRLCLNKHNPEGIKPIISISTVFRHTPSLIQDVFDLYNKKNLSGLFMFIDFEKAFDSVEWTFMFSTLSKFNLGCDFQKWVRLLYIEPRACVKNNGYFS